MTLIAVAAKGAGSRDDHKGKRASLLLRMLDCTLGTASAHLEGKPYASSAARLPCPAEADARSVPCQAHMPDHCNTSVLLCLGT